MDEKIDCLMRYMGEKGILYERYNEQLEELGFTYQETIELPGLEMEVLKYTYQGIDFDMDRQAVETLDDKIQIVINKDTYALEKKTEL